MTVSINKAHYSEQHSAQHHDRQSDGSVLIVSSRNRANGGSSGTTTANKNLLSVYLQNQHEFCLKAAKNMRSAAAATVTVKNTLLAYLVSATSLLCFINL
jgi:hypothetical protein